MQLPVYFEFAPLARAQVCNVKDSLRTVLEGDVQKDSPFYEVAVITVPPVPHTPLAVVPMALSQETPEEDLVVEFLGIRSVLSVVAIVRKERSRSRRYALRESSCSKISGLVWVGKRRILLDPEE